MQIWIPSPVWLGLSSSPAPHGDSDGIFSYAIIIAQIDIGAIEYLISWFQKVSPEQLHYEWASFSEPLVFKDCCFLQKPSFIGKPLFSIP